jgi:hypothetical protein
VSKSSSGNGSSSERRQHVRLQMNSLHKLSFELDSGIFAKIFNISIGGLGVLTEGLFLNNEQNLKGRLTVDGAAFNIDLEIVRRGETMIGGRFRQTNSDLSQAIEKYFQAEMTAQKLTRVETKSQIGDDRVKVTLFRGQNNCEFSLRERNGNIEHLRIMLLGNLIEVWANQDMVVGENLAKPKASTTGVNLFKPLPGEQAHVLENAIRFAGGLSDLSDDCRNKIVTLLKTTSVRPKPGEKNKKNSR